MEELSYQGTFVHLMGDEVETLQIVHLNDEGRVSERIVSMDGAGREIIRHEDMIHCILPDRRVVILEERREVSPLVSALPAFSEGLQQYYDLALLGNERVVERKTQVVAIHPRDEFRYGYLLWLDGETAMPLKSQLRDGQGRTVEQIVFTGIEIGHDIPASALEPAIDAEGFEHITAPEVTQMEDTLKWRASLLPDGVQALGGPDPPGRFPVSGRTPRIFGRARNHFRLHREPEHGNRSGRWVLARRQRQRLLSILERAPDYRGGEVPMRTVEVIATSITGP